MVEAALFVPAASYLERTWSTAEFAGFLAVVNASAAATAALYLILAYAITGDIYYL